MEEPKRYQIVICADGFSVSVQAGGPLYCSPSTSDTDRYAEVELGYPSRPSALLLRYASDPKDPTDTIYPYVPVEIVSELIRAHGGMISGEVPPGVEV